MNSYLTDLCTVLEKELAVGEELQANLEAQKKAIQVWDVVGLLQEIEAREPALRLLDELEKKRVETLKSVDASIAGTRLRELIKTLPHNTPERERLFSLQEETRRAYSRLQAEERYLHGLMENLMAHIHEALSPLLQATLPLYGETGTPKAAVPASGLIRSKA